MADILIRGMEMPTRCGLCPMFCDNFNDYCSAAQRSIPFDAEKPEWCPLVPLPEGHGDLIDADALVLKYKDEITQLEEWAKIHEKEGRLDMFRAFHLRSAYLAEAKLNIEAAPTIVPAEGVENE